MSAKRDEASTAGDLSAHICDFLAAQSLAPDSKLVLAYSGGVDSEVLAFGLSQFARQHPEFNYQLVYVHHGLSDNAEAWAQHCLERGQYYDLPVTVERVAVNRGPRLSLEAEARKVRYQAIERHLSENDVLLTAHHEDDQLETILLALKRGQGPKGLAAMGQVQALAQGKQLRPLLDISREQIEAYAKQQGLVHIEDESNQDDKYDRNFLRLEIIPRLKARWPSIATTASRSAALCAEQQATLDLQVSERLPLWLTQAPYHTQSVFKLDGFAEQSADWQALLLRGFIESQGFALPSKVQLKQIITQLLNAKDDAKVHIRVGECEIRRFANQVYLFKYQTHKRHTQPVSWTLPQHDFISLLQGDSTELVVLPEGLANGEQIRLIVTEQGPRVRLPLPDEVVSVRYQLAGQFRCHPHSRGKGRELKKLWQEFAIPPWVREKVGFVFYGEQLVMAIGLWVEKGFIVESNGLGLQVFVEEAKEF
ncbi:tRNA lysidine(34) synthetase TilS [Shewanella sp. SW36]|uniref:tRNA lysidine(34) synthetase TilS n=1 Tax=unclassified Shewanella TaxID=196818 RepID=UPI0021D9ABB3|nr:MULTISPECIES: tRNA lysidine(34) synthetase TilS [unclassified Shewanella]MCU7973818.1 tRNA lysidine(34) synthetase TilS [Shewanella sp. SW36]MCU7989427.1 tRNA lysidine(34) synthetase TilS [Shewanella sp. SW1]MCU8016377.1 tRNA lysidine(34) synthetase TilS [Shewanella sp. SM72]MCU8051102.1 tRNA lysidine(34) synthetase TilS [Shewanella sp. SM43]